MEGIKMEKKERNTILILFLATVLLRFIGLYFVNPYINIDEAAIGYSSWCLGNYGTDRYCNSFPIYIENFYGGQSPAYAYLLIPIVKIFGLNLISVRSLSSICYCIAFWSFYYLIKDKDKTFRFFAMLLYTISPVMIWFGRIALDCNLMMPFLINACACLKKAMEEKSTLWYSITAAAAAAVLYTYSLAYLILPIFILAAIGLLLKTKQITIKQVLIAAAIFLLIAFPGILQMVTMVFIKEKWSLGPFTFIAMETERASELSIPSIKRLPKLLASFFASDYLCSSFFIKDYRMSVPFAHFFSNFYFLTIPFLLYGIWITLKKSIADWKKKQVTIDTAAILLFFISMIGYLCLSWILTYRINGILFLGIYFAGAGIQGLVKKKWSKHLLFYGYLGSFVLFSIFYFGGIQKSIQDKQPSLSAMDFSKELAYLKKITDETDNIYILGSDNNWLFGAFSLGGVNPYEVKSFDDREEVVDYSIKNLHVKLPEEYDPNAHYLVSNGFKHNGCTDELLKQIKEMNCIEFKNYNLYLPKEAHSAY